MEMEMEMDMGCLPTDVMLDILSRLPVKTLVKFRCVSKQWSCYLFSDPHFRDLHRRQADNKQILFLFVRRSEEISGNGCTLYLTSMDDRGRVGDEFSKTITRFKYLVHSISDLILIDGYQDIIVCNPFTREIVTLPEGSPIFKSNYSYQVLGFGYLPSTQEYKVVRLFYRSSEHFPNGTGCVFDIGCEIFSITEGGTGSNSWRVIDESCPYEVFYPSTFINGSLHWITRNEYGRPEGVMILSFDIEDEKFRVVPHPQDLDIEQSETSLLVLRDFLCISQFEGPLGEEMDIWMLKDYDNHVWVKEYRINFTTMDGFEPWLLTYPRYYRNEEILFEKEDHEGQLYFYNFGSFRSMNVVEHYSGFVLCRESLFSLGSI